MLGVVRVFARDEIWSGLLTASQVLFYPDVLFDFPFENSFRRLHPVARQILAFGHNADADHVSMLRDVPKPSLVWDVCNCRRAFVDARIAPGALVVGPNRNF